MEHERAFRSARRIDDSTAPATSPGKTTLTSRIIARAAAEPEAGPPMPERSFLIAHESASGTGTPLPADTRERFEGSLGADLGGVRVHTGAASAEAADAIGARAYTVGNDIHFANGQYDPSTAAGQHLIAHEVAHTVQQAGGVRAKLAVTSPGDAVENEADAAADAMVAGRSAQVGGAGGAVMRDANMSMKPPSDANFTDKEYLRKLGAEASLIAKQLDNGVAAKSLAGARTSLDGCKTLTESIAATYAEAQDKVIKGQIEMQEKKVEDDKQKHELVKTGITKALELLIPGATVAEKAGEKVGGLAGKAIGFLIEKAIGKAIDKGADAATDALLGKTEKVSDVKLPKSQFLVDLASAKQLWALGGRIDGIYDQLLTLHPKATALVAEIEENVGAIDSGKDVMVKTDAKFTSKAPKSVPEIEAMVQRLRDAQAAADQAAAAATELGAAIAEISTDLKAVQALTTVEYAMQQIGANAGFDNTIVASGTSMGTVDVTEMMKTWNRMVGETVTATTDCKPDGLVKVPYYPAKAVAAAPDQPKVKARVGDGLGELATGQPARIIAIAEVSFYYVTVVVHPLAAAPAPAYNGEVCEG